MFSISFGNGSGQELNTWVTWGIVPTERPEIAPPEPQINVVDIPGGVPLDLTEAITGRVEYGQREGSWNFIFHSRRPDDVRTAYQSIINNLHGQRVAVRLSQRPDWYYTGRCQVGQLVPGGRGGNSGLEISYTLDPYRLFCGQAGNWLWDPMFDDASNVIYYGRFVVAVSKARTLINPTAAPITPTITVDRAMMVSANGQSYQLAPGDNTGPTIPASGSLEATFYGPGTVMIDYGQLREL
jgi:hypothetical protein